MKTRHRQGNLFLLPKTRLSPSCNQDPRCRPYLMIGEWEIMMLRALRHTIAADASCGIFTPPSIIQGDTRSRSLTSARILYTQSSGECVEWICGDRRFTLNEFSLFPCSAWFLEGTCVRVTEPIVGQLFPKIVCTQLAFLHSLTLSQQYTCASNTQLPSHNKPLTA